MESGNIGFEMGDVAAHPFSNQDGEFCLVQTRMNKVNGLKNPKANNETSMAGKKDLSTGVYPTFSRQDAALKVVDGALGSLLWADIMAKPTGDEWP